MRISMTLLTLAALTLIVGTASTENRKRADERANSRKLAPAKVTENTRQQIAPATEQPTNIDSDSAESKAVILQTANIVTGITSPSAGEQIKWQVIASGGGRGTSTSYALSGTVGQTAVGIGNSTNYKINQGFWQNFSSGCCAKEGDFNHSGQTNVVDLTAYVAFLFQGGAIYFCKEEADVDDNNTVNVVDLTKVVAFLFQGGSIGVCP